MTDPFEQQDGPIVGAYDESSFEKSTGRRAKRASRPQDIRLSTKAFLAQQTDGMGLLGATGRWR
jgi:hypothetical protein